MSQLQVIPLFLLPLSCIVVPIRDLENITSNTPTFYTTILNMALDDNVTMSVNLFDALFQNVCDNYNEVRGRSLALSAHSPRTASMSLSNCEKDYATRLEK